MKGIQYLVDEKGEQTAVVIDLTKHRKLWEDFYDALIARSRAKEPHDNWDTVKTRLRRQGKLSA